MYAMWARAALSLRAPPVTLTITSGARRTVRLMCAICCGVNRSGGPARPVLTKSKNGARSERIRTVRLLTTRLPADDRRSGECEYLLLKTRHGLANGSQRLSVYAGCRAGGL